MQTKTEGSKREWTCESPFGTEQIIHITPCGYLQQPPAPASDQRAYSFPTVHTGGCTEWAGKVGGHVRSPFKNECHRTRPSIIWGKWYPAKRRVDIQFPKMGRPARGPEEMRKTKQANNKKPQAVLVKVTHPQRQVIQVVVHYHIWDISRAIDARQLPSFPGTAAFRRPRKVINWTDLRTPIRPEGNIQADTGTHAAAISTPHRRP